MFPSTVLFFFEKNKLSANKAGLLSFSPPYYRGSITINQINKFIHTIHTLDSIYNNG